MIQTNKSINLTADGRLPLLSDIRELFNNACRNELYGKKFSGLSLDSWEDYFNLPLTHKEEMQKLGPEGLLAVPRSEAWHYHESFGTTGIPVSTWFTYQDYEREANQTWRWTSAIKAGTLLLQRFPYSFAVPPFILELKCSREGGVIVPAGYLSWNVSYPRVLELIKRLKIDAIGCLPNELIILEMMADRCGYDLKRDLGSLKHVLVSGGIVTNGLRKYIEKRWNAKVSSVYGSTETGGIASTCSAGNLHIHSDAFIVEVLDPLTWKQVKPGETGVLVVTSYYRKAAPLFRYVTKDICCMMQGSCPCGDPVPVIKILGRMNDTIELNGEKIYPYLLDQSILDFTEQFDSAVYFVIVTRNKLHIRIETHNGLKKPSAESLEELNKALKVPVKVHICSKGELLDTRFLMRAPEVYKPASISDWRSRNIKSVTITDALIKWPEIGFSEFMDIIRRSLKNRLLKRILK